MRSSGDRLFAVGRDLGEELESLGGRVLLGSVELRLSEDEYLTWRAVRSGDLPYRGGSALDEWAALELIADPAVRLAELESLGLVATVDTDSLESLLIFAASVRVSQTMPFVRVPPPQSPEYQPIGVPGRTCGVVGPIAHSLLLAGPLHPDLASAIDEAALAYGTYISTPMDPRDVLRRFVADELAVLLAELAAVLDPAVGSD